MSGSTPTHVAGVSPGGQSKKGKMARQPRQRPISCQFCRLRKLRCSRIFPCSNCTSRGVTCVQLAGPSGRSMSQVKDLPHNSNNPTPAESSDASPIDGPAPASSHRQHSLSHSFGGGGSMDGGGRGSFSGHGGTLEVSGSFASEMMLRLEKLEAMVASQNALLETRSLPQGQHHGGSHSRRETLSHPPIPPKLQGLTDDALWLEKAAGGQMLKENLMTDNIVFRPCQIRMITKQPFWMYPAPNVNGGYEDTEPTKCIWLPRRDEADVMLHKYISDITHFHHVLHTPSIRVAIDELYNALDRQEALDLGSVVLLLSLTASVTYAWIPADDGSYLFSSAQEANSQSIMWIRACLDVIDLAERKACLNTSMIHGVIIAFFVLCNIEGISQRARSLVAKGIALAREMAIHRTDSTLPSDRVTMEGISEVKKELRRRLWWYLVATDWMLAQFSVPQEGTYTIMPDHMTCRWPANLNDEDLVEGKEIIERPKDEPTHVSYFIQRLRLAEICRATLDQSPLSHMNPDQNEYRHVLEVDTKLNQLIKDLPPFMNLSSSKWRSYGTDSSALSPSLTVQRYIFNLIIHRQLCKFHLPYLPRGTVEPAYAYSREACLKSAKMIVKIEQELEQELLPFVSRRKRLTMVLRSMFLASIVFVLDACLKDDSAAADGIDHQINRDDIDDSNDMLIAWRLFTNARPFSSTAPKVLELSMEVLRKHKPDHPALKTITLQQQGISTAVSGFSQGVFPPTPESAQRSAGSASVGGEDVIGTAGAQAAAAAGPGSGPGPIVDGSMGMLSSLNGVADSAFLQQQWNALDGNRMDLENIDWDRIVWGLDAPFI